MTQTPRDANFQAALGLRLGLLLDQYLHWNLSSLAAKLGYTNDSALRKVRKGQAGLSADKLALLAELPVGKNAERISIDWLLTGHGAPLTAAPAEAPQTELLRRVGQAPPEVQQRIAHFLDVQEARAVVATHACPPPSRSLRR
ncbi:hypothetical protein [Lysobacter sp. yr284]|uniref:hypothetical protein n=1 Tax=Lysobacter sp. yr284 TaxID=1761791 RepID=UPI0011144B5B|nr:hypothetical protein [Lysobacter sp. yr284]